MQRKSLAGLVIALAVATAPALPAVQDQTDAFVRSQMDAFHLPGLSLAVVRDGRVVKVAAYGFADMARQVPATPETVYKIGSVSKQFIATAIMLLVQEGRVRLDDPIRTYLAKTPAAWAPITVRHLLTHTGGIVRESPAFDPMKAQTDAEVIRAAYAVPLRFTPRARWEYSNTGYYALAEIVRVVSGQAWSEFLRQRVFAPAGMTSTATTGITPRPPNRATGYTGDNNARVADEWVAVRPSGAFLSTVLDLAKWDVLLDGDTPLAAATRDQMWTPVQLSDGNTHPYGFGWHVETRGRRRLVWHGGGLPGFTAQYLRFIDDRLAVIVLANGDDVDIGGIAHGVARQFLP